MSYQTQTIKCPSCGAEVRIADVNAPAVCSYCGSSVVVNNQNEFVYRHVDEASVKQAEVRLRELEIEKMKVAEAAALEKELKEKRKKAMKIYMPTGIGFIVLGVIGLSVRSGFMSSLLIAGIVVLVVCNKIYNPKSVQKKMNAEPASADVNRLRLPESVETTLGKDYRTVEQTLRNAGFTNITCIEKKDLTLGFFNKPGEIVSMSVDGSEDYKMRYKYRPDVPIIITYHGFSR